MLGLLRGWGDPLESGVRVSVQRQSCSPAWHPARTSTLVGVQPTALTGALCPPQPEYLQAAWWTG